MIVHNYLATPKSLDLSLDGDGPDGDRPGGIDAGRSRSCSRRTARHASTGGSAPTRSARPRVTGKAIADTDSDAVELPIPVLPFGLRRDASQSGSLSSGGTATANLTIPAESNPAARTIQVSLAPSLAGSLLGALDFLTGYPYGCTEQTLSAFLPTLVVARTMAQLKLAPTERLSQLDRQATAGLNAAARLPARGRRLGMVEDGREPSVHDRLRDVRSARDEGRRLQGARTIGSPTASPALARLYRKYPRARARAQGLHAVRAGARARARRSSRPISKTARSIGPPRLSDVWSARDRLTPYGRAVLLLTLNALNDRARRGARARSAGRGQASRRPRVVADRSRSAARRLGRHERRSHGHRGAGARRPSSRAARSSRPRSATSSPTASRACTGSARSRRRWCCTA